jgi:hypothetical protein
LLPQILFLNELEEVLDLAGPEPVLPVLPLLGRTLAKAATSPHFQVRAGGGQAGHPTAS